MSDAGALSDAPLLVGPVEVVGAGLLGTSIALACRRAGLEVLLTDVAPENVRTASGLGAGRARTDADAPQLVVVAVPPDHLGATRSRGRWPRRTRWSPTSAASRPARWTRSRAGRRRSTRYVGGHPMAGSERSGPLAASAALFDGRPWAVTPHPDVRARRGGAGRGAGRGCAAAVPVRLTPDEHDRAVARTSHLPHLLAVLVAGRLADAPPEHLALSGQGVRDVTRIAAGDPALWQQIVAGNAAAVLGLLGEVRGPARRCSSARSRDGDARRRSSALLDRGVAGTRAIPGKHGGPVRPTALGVRLGARPPGRAGPAVRRRRRERRQHRGRPHRPRPGPPGRPGRAAWSRRTRAEHLLASLESRGWVTHR